MPSFQVGLFGGTFDPPHLGHLILAAESARQLSLSRVLWMLAPDPPHKLNQVITPLPHRLAMLERAIAGNPLFEISFLEINRPGPHYTVDTLALLAAQEPQAEITLLLGGDSLRDLPKWHNPAGIVSAVHRIGVMRRPEDEIDISALEAQIHGLKNKVHFIHALMQELSSRELRRRIQTGGEYRYYLPHAVYEYIESHRLYNKPLANADLS